MRLGIGLVMALDAVVDLKLLILEQLLHDTCTGTKSESGAMCLGSGLVMALDPLCTLDYSHACHTASPIRQHSQILVSTLASHRISKQLFWNGC